MMYEPELRRLSAAADKAMKSLERAVVARTKKEVFIDGLSFGMSIGVSATILIWLVFL